VAEAAREPVQLKFVDPLWLAQIRAVRLVILRQCFAIRSPLTINVNLRGEIRAYPTKPRVSACGVGFELANGRKRALGSPALDLQGAPELLRGVLQVSTLAAGVRFHQQRGGVLPDRFELL